MSITSARLLGGRYQLHTMLGRGGMAAVWAGVDTRLDRPIAVKVVDAAAGADPAKVQRLDREARTVARLAHPNIVSVYDVGHEGGVPYLVMELVAGDDLQRRLARGPLELAAAVGIAAQICAALEAAHDAGVVHRDIKPDNVLLTQAGMVKVCDFGIAGLVAGLRPANSGAVPGTATTVGTSEYMAPEQAIGGPVDARTDLYALGCVLYAMLTGAPPFAGEDASGVLWQQVYQPPAPVSSHRPDVPADLANLVGRLLAKDPAGRPATAGEVRGLLMALPGIPPSAFEVPVAVPVGPPALARAAVVTRTRAMPAVDVPDRHPAAGSGFRLGLAGIAAVAVGAAAVTALLVALLMAGPAAQVAAPDPSASGGASSAGTAPTTPQGTVDGLRAVIAGQVQDGHLGEDAAEDLTDRLDEVERYLARGQTNRAAGKLEDLREKLDGFYDEGDVSDVGYQAIRASVDQLASTIPSDNDNRGRD